MKRISVGGAFFYVGVGAVAEAARELLEQGTYGFWSTAGPGRGRRAAPRSSADAPSPARKAITSGSAAGSCAKNACPPS